MGKMKARAALASFAVLLLASCNGSGGSVESMSLAGGRYVAIGSSMAAGPGLGPTKPGTPPRCTRTFANYPTLLAQSLRLTLYDQSCSGARTEHVLGTWGELAAQIDAVTPGTRLVTVTIGGNDLNYVGGLLNATCRGDGMMTFAGKRFPCPPPSDPSEADYDQVESNMLKIAAEVKLRAPDAELVFVQNQRLIPETLCDATPLSAEVAAKGRQIAQRLADIIAQRLADINVRVAQQTGAVLVPMHDLSQGHSPCDAEPWAIGSPPNYDGSDGATWHPSSAGMRAEAIAVESALTR